MKRILLAMLTAGSLMSAQAAIHEYSVVFAPEAVGATGSGTGSVFYDDVNHSLLMQATYTGLTGPNVTATHFHGPTTVPGSGTFGIAVGNPTLPNFPTGTSGTYSETLDLTQSTVYNTTFFNNNGGTAASAESAFFDAMNEGRIYWNIHTTTFGSGEIRGFLTVVPEPSSFALAGLGILGVAARVWSKRRENKL